MPDAIATIAFDRASSRNFDQDGHLHVISTNISKATVNPYLGREIPDYEALGLDAGQIYQLFRDPDELAKAVESFNGKPLLFDHKPVHADDHDHAMTVGSVTNARYVPPYLKADLSIWSGPAIRAIEDGSQKELSSAYRYVADMTPGTFQGARFDGRMTNIACNHVALVAKGRAGSDVVVGDSMENITMAKTALSGAAAQTQGALVVYLKSKLAQDAKVDLRPVIAGLTTANFAARKGKLAHDVKKLTAGKLAQDASIDDVAEVIEALAEILPEEVPEIVEEMGGTDDAPDDDITTDEPDDARAKLSAAGFSDDEITKMLAALEDTSAPVMDADKKDVKPAMDKNMVTKPAMDAAIVAAVRASSAALEAKFRSLDEARREVRQRHGEVNIALDSAVAVYRSGLDIEGVAHTDVPDSAVPALYRAICAAPKAAPKPARIAQDAAAAAETVVAFPHMNRLA